MPQIEDIFKGSKPKFGKPFEKYVAATQVPHHVDPLAYYDEAADQKQIQAYYAQVTVADPKERISQLRDLVTRSHKQDSPGYHYTVTKHLYADVDRYPDGTVRSIYSREPVPVLTYPDVSLQTLAEKDISQIAAAAVVAPEVLGAWMCFQKGAAALNCEHVVPQSFFNEKEPMRSDLHHLYACESGENNRRGSTPYGQYVPEGGKGEVARATLYFMLRYPKVHLPYNAKTVELLKQWSADDPPDLHERHRNRQIEIIQGNRNPFIDHPEWVTDFFPAAR